MMEIREINSGKSWMWDQDLPENMNGSLVVRDLYLLENINRISGNLESVENPDGQCLENLDSPEGGGAPQIDNYF